MSAPLDDLLASDSLESVTFTREQLKALIARVVAEGVEKAASKQPAEKAGGLSDPTPEMVLAGRVAHAGIMGGVEPDDYDAAAACYRAMHAARPAAEKAGGLSAHDQGIIRDLEAMAAQRDNGFWPQALAIGALRLIRPVNSPAAADAGGLSGVQQSKLQVPRTYQQTPKERDAIERYGRACARAALAARPTAVMADGLAGTAAAKRHAERIDAMHKGVVGVFAAIKAEHEAGGLSENEEDPGVLWSEIHRLRDDAKGPEGFSTWKHAAIAERQRRVRAEGERQPAMGAGSLPIPTGEQLYTMVTSRFKSGRFPWSMVAESGKAAWEAAAADLVFAPDTIAAKLARPTASGAGGLILKGVGKIDGDGWKDTTRKGEVVFVWNTEMPKPYAPGQYPRIGNQCGWTASTDQYDFTPATAQESAKGVDLAIEKAVRQSEDAQRLDAMENMTPEQCLSIIEAATRQLTLRKAIDEARHGRAAANGAAARDDKN